MIQVDVILFCYNLPIRQGESKDGQREKKGVSRPFKANREREAVRLYDKIGIVFFCCRVMGE